MCVGRQSSVPPIFYLFPGLRFDDLGMLFCPSSPVYYLLRMSDAGMYCVAVSIQRSA